MAPLTEFQSFLTEVPAFYENADPLLRIKTQKDADTYVKHTFDIATPEEKESIVRAFFCWSRKRVRQGGAAIWPDDRILKLIAVADTCHDFQEAGYENVVFPKWFPHAAVKNENHFIQAITTRETLVFENHSVHNPLYRANILDSFDIVAAHAANPGATIDDLFQQQQNSFYGKQGNHARFLPVDVWTILDESRNRKRAVLRLKQVAQLIGVLQNRYGCTTEFVLDASGDSLTALIFALPFLTRAFLKQFSTDSPSSSLHEIRTQMKLVLAKEATHPCDWEVRLTDANIFDAAQNALSLHVDVRPTGQVYPPGWDYQVSLGGIPNAQRGRFVPVEIEEGGAKHNIKVTNKECTTFLSTAALKALMNVPPLDVATDCELEKTILRLTKVTRLALKRAGDWGQVMNCKRYGKVFVTKDRLAALFAAAMGVRFVLVRFQENLREELPLLPEFFRYTFVLG